MKHNSSVLRKIEDLRIIPVVTFIDAKRAVDVAKALIDGGLPCIEIAFRTPVAADALECVAALEGLLAGAGTVRTREQAHRAKEAGAQFLVTPGVGRDVIEYAHETKTTIFPGIATPTDIEAALSYGIESVKFFPAESFGGVRTLKAMSGPYPEVRFIPTGGITAKNLGSYLDLSQVLACGGSWLAKEDLIADGRYDAITKLTRAAVEIAAA
jgi:2-dehydro-3-deoxyphosphogluconate aldolase/(4S)-4-hydroxy-2-oxoglutarate aldolase